MIYLVTPELLAKGLERGAFQRDPKELAAAWYPGSVDPPAPPGPVYVNPNAK